VKSPKKEEREIVIPVEDLSPIAHPLAQKKLLKKLQKTIKRGELLSWSVVQVFHNFQQPRRPVRSSEE
jgi:hypothetical protein